MTIARSARQSVLKRDKYTCKGCGLFDPSGNSLTLDHMTPKARGGVNAQWNLQILCYECNNKKGDMTMVEWLEWRNDDKETETGTQDSYGALDR